MHRALQSTSPAPSTQISQETLRLCECQNLQEYRLAHSRRCISACSKAACSRRAVKKKAGLLLSARRLRQRCAVPQQACPPPGSGALHLSRLAGRQEMRWRAHPMAGLPASEPRCATPPQACWATALRCASPRRASRAHGQSPGCFGRSRATTRGTRPARCLRHHGSALVLEGR